jgi:hypothetical protein
MFIVQRSDCNRNIKSRVMVYGYYCCSSAWPGMLSSRYLVFPKLSTSEAFASSQILVFSYTFSSQCA